MASDLQVQNLLDAKANPFHTDLDGNTPLALALVHRSKTVLIRSIAYLLFSFSLTLVFHASIIVEKVGKDAVVATLRSALKKISQSRKADSVKESPTDSTNRDETSFPKGLYCFHESTSPPLKTEKLSAWIQSKRDVDKRAVINPLFIHINV